MEIEKEISKQGSLKEIGLLFFKLGCIAFGGPAAHISMMDDEVVTRRKWLSRDHFLDLVGATNLIPGPNSTEMTMHVGFERGGWRGLFLAGSAFIFPAATITLILAWLYVQYGELPQVQPLLWGIKPAVLVIILSALWKLGRKAIKSWQLAVLGAVVFTAVMLGIDEVLALLMGGLLGMLIWGLWRKWRGLSMLVWWPGVLQLDFSLQNDTTVSLWKLALFFLKVGVTLYGSGYVLVAYLQGGLVEQLGWLNQTQLLDAIAIGQFTPGPVLTTATFVGYLVAGFPGAIIATIAIFLPSFLFVLILNPLIPKMRQSNWLSAFLDAVNVASVGLMTAVLLLLARGTLVDWQSILIMLVTAVAIFRFKLSSLWVVLLAALLGFVLQWAT
ncbi:MAG: chromate efflux transporter [Chloroflexi bacterium]|nr:chromate efflux transporter [Chloroflexota bacterium]